MKLRSAFVPFFLVLAAMAAQPVLVSCADSSRDGGSEASRADSAPAGDAVGRDATTDAGRPGPVPEGLTEGETRDIGIFRRASPATVFITSLALRRSWLSLDVTTVPQGSGTGFVWDTEGHIVTNFHVVQTRERNTTYRVTLWDHSEYEATVVGAAPGKDLAVLQIDAPRDLLRPLALGTSHDLVVGQKVLALGNPFGLDHTLTTGVISALGRDLEAPDGRTIRDVIQTDAAINPGNSGGPLLDSSGRLIGVNTAIASPSGAYAGIGFAIPSDTVRRLVPQLIEHREPIRPGIGISILSDYQARQYGFDGIAVVEVVRGMPAERAGIEPVTVTRGGRVRGDVIVGVNGQRVRTRANLLDAFEDAGGVGATVELALLNAGRTREVKLQLIEVNR